MTLPAMQPLLDNMLFKPRLLAERARAYGELILDEWTESKTFWRKRTTLQVLGACSMGVSCTLAGMGLMLWAVMPPAQIHAFWLLVATPLVFLAAGAGCLMAADKQHPPVVFEQTRQQLKADLEVLKHTSLTAKATELIVQPIATEHPYRLVLGAALVGALLVRTRPLTWLSGSAALLGLLPKVIGALGKQSKI